MKKVYEVLPESLIGAVDIDPNKVGEDMGTLIDTDPIGINVVSSIEDVSKKSDGPRFAICATGSNLESVWPQIKDLIDNGFSVVSTCEELSYPWARYPELAKEIDTYAADNGVTVIGSGVNPGYVMDTLVLSLTSVVSAIQSIQVYRNVDVTKRRLQLQKKVGVGMEKGEFTTLAKEGKIGHVGLEESLRLIAGGLNLTLEEVTNQIKPSIAEKAYHSDHFSVEPGDVNGQIQSSVGATDNGVTIDLFLTMSTDVESEDRIVIKGDREQQLVIPGGVFGDSATASIMVNVVKTLLSEEKTGLQTMKDIPLTRDIFM